MIVCKITRKLELSAYGSAHATMLLLLHEAPSWSSMPTSCAPCVHALSEACKQMDINMNRDASSPCSSRHVNSQAGHMCWLSELMIVGFPWMTWTTFVAIEASSCIMPLRRKMMEYVCNLVHLRTLKRPASRPYFTAVDSASSFVSLCTHASRGYSAPSQQRVQQCELTYKFPPPWSERH